MFELVRQLWECGDTMSVASEHSYGASSVTKETLVPSHDGSANVNMALVRTSGLTEIIEPLGIQDAMGADQVPLIRYPVYLFIYLRLVLNFSH